MQPLGLGSPAILAPQSARPGSRDYPNPKVAFKECGRMTETIEPIQKVSIIVSHGSLEGVYPGLIMANGARMEGIEASLFFTFFGLDAIIKKRMNSLKVTTV